MPPSPVDAAGVYQNHSFPSMHRVQVIRHQARVKGINLDDTYLGQEIAEAMPEMVLTRSGGSFQLRGEMRTFAQENPMANEAILSTRLRQLLLYRPTPGRYWRGLQETQIRSASARRLEIQGIHRQQVRLARW